MTPQALYVAIEHCSLADALALAAAHDEVNPPPPRPHDPESSVAPTIPSPRCDVYERDPRTIPVTEAA
jgi:hypothetical protein